MDYINYVLCFVLCYFEIQATKEFSKGSRNSSAVTEEEKNSEWDTKLSNARYNYGQIQPNETSSLKIVEDLPKNIFRWKGFGRTHAEFIGFGDNIVTIGDRNSYQNKKYPYSIIAVADNLYPEEINLENLFFAVKNDDQYQIISYAVRDKHLVELWSETVPYEINNIIAWQKNLILISGRRMELLVKDKDDIIIPCSVYLPDTPTQITAAIEANLWIISVLLPKQDQVIIYSIDSRKEFMQFTYVTTLKSKNVQSLTSFRLGLSNYIAIGGENSGVWRLNSDQPEPIRFSPGSVDYWLAIPLATYRHDVLLLAQTNDVVAVVEPDGYNHLQTVGNIEMFCRETAGKCPELVSKIDLSKACSAMDTAIIPTHDGQTFLLTLNHALENIPDQVDNMSDELEELKARLLKHFEGQDRLAELFLKENELIIDLSEDNVIAEKWSVENFVADDADFLPVSEKDGLFMNSELFAGRTDWSEDDQNTNLVELKEKAMKLRSNFLDVKDELHRFLFSNIVINDKMEHKITAEGSIIANEVFVEKMNGLSVDNWLSNSVRWDYLRPIDGLKIVDVLEVNNLELKEFDGISAADLLFVNDDIIVNGNLVIEGNADSQNIILPPSGQVNEMFLKKDLLMIDQLFEGNVTFENVEILEASMVNEILRNNKKPSAILPDNILLVAKEIAMVPATRVDFVDVKKQLNVSYINGVSLEELFKKYNQAERDLSTSTLNLEYLNNRKFPDEYVQISDSNPVALNGVKKFNNLKVDDLYTGKEIVNDLFGNQSRLFYSLFSKSNDEEVDFLRSEASNVSIVFSDLQVDGAIVTEMVNNKTWDHLENLISVREEKRKNKERCMGRLANDIGNIIDLDLTHLIADRIEVLGNVTTNSKISNFSLHHFQNYLSKTKEQIIPEATINSPINVTGSVTIKNVDLSKDSPVTKLSILNVTGGLHIENLTFSNHVTFKDVTLNGLVSGIKLHELVEDTVKITNETIELRGNKVFANKLKVKDLNAHTYNGETLLNVVTVNSDVMFSGPIIIKGNVEINEDLFVFGFINDVNLTDIQSGLSTDLASFYVPGDFILAPGAVIKNLNVDGKIQGINFNEFLEDAVYVNGDFEISTENLTFLNSVIFENDLNVTEILNGVDLELFLTDVVFLNRQSSLKNLIITKSSLISNLNATSLTAPLIEGCDVGRWKDEAILLNKVAFVPGIVKFDELSVNGNVNCATINGRSVASLITLKDPKVIPADVHFQSINIKKKIIVNQLINNVHLHSVWKDSLRDNAYQLITGAKIFLKDVKVRGSINVESIGNRSLSDIITLHTDQNITSHLNFSEGAIFDYDLLTKGLISGVNVTEWNSRLLFHPGKQIINGSWVIHGNISVKGRILGSGIVLDKGLINATDSLKIKLKDSEQIQQEINLEFENQCNAVSDSAALTQNQIRTLEMFEDTQGLEYKRDILSVINYKSENNHYLLVSFGNRCAGNLYIWNSTSVKYQRLSLKKIGSVYVWGTVSAPNGLYLIISGPHSCENKKPFGGIWHVKGGEFRKLVNIEPFTDIITDTESPSIFYTISSNGTVYSWSFSQETFERTKVVHLAPGPYKFVPFSLRLGLAVWDGDVVTTIQKDGRVSAHTRLLAAGVAVSDNGLTAVTDGIGRIELYRDKTILDIIYISKPSHLLWIDLKSPGELYLCFVSENHKILIYQYKGVAGLVFQASLNNPSSGLILLQLPYSSGTINHLLRYHDKTMHLLQVVMNGQPAIYSNLNCTV